jgi:protein-tyrosine phosphatase
MGQGLVDLHAHVLPGLDDGPTGAEESLALLVAMARQGVTTVVAAAHALDGRYNATRDVVLRETERVSQLLVQQSIPVRLLPSMEIYLTFDVLRAAADKQLLGINNSRSLVVELPGREFPLYTERALFELLMAGYRPILNHPERNRGIQRNPDLMLRLADHGVTGMVTAASLLGRFGPEAQRLAQTFLREGAAELVVSDAHDLEGRAPLLPDGLEAARAFGKPDQAAEFKLIS